MTGQHDIPPDVDNSRLEVNDGHASGVSPDQEGASYFDIDEAVHPEHDDAEG